MNLIPMTPVLRGLICEQRPGLSHLSSTEVYLEPLLDHAGKRPFVVYTSRRLSAADLLQFDRQLGHNQLMLVLDSSLKLDTAIEQARVDTYGGKG